MAWDSFRLQTRLNLDAAIFEQVYALIAKIDAVKNSGEVSKQLLP